MPFVCNVNLCFSSQDYHRNFFRSVGEVCHNPVKLSISEHSGSIGLCMYLSAKGAEEGGQSLADMSAKKSSFFMTHSLIGST